MNLVSVLMPVHNGARYIEASARSVLNQTHRALELLIIDDASTDASRSIAESLDDERIRVVVNEQRLGLASTLNRGLREAAGHFVARQDADDLSHPERLERQLQFLERHSQVGLIGTLAWIMDEESRVVDFIDRACDHEVLAWELLFDNPFVHTSVMFRKDIVEAAGGYDDAWAYNQDYDLWTRLARTTRVANLPLRLVAWRAHAQSMTGKMASEAASANRRIQARAVRDAIGLVPAEEVELVSRSREGMTLPELRRFLPVLLGWAAAYEPTLDPKVRGEFRRALGRQGVNLARSQGKALRLATVLLGYRRRRLDLICALLTWLGEKATLRLKPSPIATLR